MGSCPIDVTSDPLAKTRALRTTRNSANGNAQYFEVATHKDTSRLNMASHKLIKHFMRRSFLAPTRNSPDVT